MSTEVVKHTQQEVGGYLLAKKISEDFTSILDLVIDGNFNEKIIGEDPSKHHQLRLDILKFLIAMRPEIIVHLRGKDGLILSWWYLYNGFDYNSKSDIPNKLLAEEKSKLILTDILNVSKKLWFVPENVINFYYISQFLSRFDLWKFETNWTFIIYKDADFFYDFVNENIEKIKVGDKSSCKTDALVAKFISFITSTNIRELRDLATIYLMAYGKRYPNSLLEITEQSVKLEDIYIYERLASCCYGVALNLQNDNGYIEQHLRHIARRLFNLQFAENSEAPVYNYIVIDSIKHLLDLAVFKQAHDFSEIEIERFSTYTFNPPHKWIPPTTQQSELIRGSSEMDWPEPIGMDFGIYTIPRLIVGQSNRKIAVSHVYKRIFELGYQDLDTKELTNETFQDFYWGNKIDGRIGKSDRLGKKYSWKAFFDYAGFLLLNKQLNVFEQNDSAKNHYTRLGDVDIDICMPNASYKLDLRIYTENLLSKRDANTSWYLDQQIDTITPFFEYKFYNDNYIMLYGMVEQRLNKDYDVRSFLLIETFFIKKNFQVENLQHKADRVFDWDLDNHFSPDRLRNVYFGELYWADTFYEYEIESISIPTGDEREIKRRLSLADILGDDNYSHRDIGKEVSKTIPEMVTFESEHTLAEYLWESDSKILKGFSEYYPSIQMGKLLGLRVEPSKGKVLASDYSECYHCVHYQDKNHFTNTFNYMKSDLLRKYMAENNLILLYQVKQHSYDEDRQHNRGMKFYTLE